MNVSITTRVLHTGLCYDMSKDYEDYSSLLLLSFFQAEISRQLPFVQHYQILQIKSRTHVVSKEIKFEILFRVLLDGPNLRCFEKHLHFQNEKLVMFTKYKHVVCKELPSYCTTPSASFQAMEMHAYAYDFQFDTSLWHKYTSEKNFLFPFEILH